MGNPTRFPNGISTNAVTYPFGNFPLPDMTDVAYAVYDFDQYVAADWTVTNTTSHYTIGLVAASSTVPAGGVLGLVAGGSTVNTDVAAIQANPLNFYFTAGQQVWFEAHVIAANASNEQFVIGLASSAATLAPTDGIYFAKAAASTNIDFVVRTSSTSTTASNIATFGTGNTRLSFYYNGKDSVSAYVNNVLLYQQTVLTNLPVSVALGPALAIKASATAPTAAAYRSDYISCAQERSY